MIEEFFYDYNQLTDLVLAVNGVNITPTSLSEMPSYDDDFFIDETYSPQGTLSISSSNPPVLTIEDIVTKNIGNVNPSAFVGGRPPHPPHPPKF